MGCSYADAEGNELSVPCEVVGEQEGLCNITIDEREVTVPTCKTEELLPCLTGNCTAMVCGDFAFNPKPALPVTVVEKGEPVDVGGVGLAEGEEGQAQNFYGVGCRFMPTQSEFFNNLMKNGDGSVNVFRIGFGDSFEEYEQYRYFLPITDRFCSSRPTQDGLIDRYINYITAEDKNPFDPQEDLPACISGDAMLGSPGPADRTDPLDAPLPDYNNYDFESFRLEQRRLGGGETRDYVFRELDVVDYKKGLIDAYGADMFGLSGPIGRAPFECVMGTPQCYSGACSTDSYSRIVFQSVDGRAVVSDCGIANIEGNSVLFCPPTKRVYLDGGQLKFEYAGVNVVPLYFDVEGNNRPGDANARCNIINYGLLLEDVPLFETVWVAEWTKIDDDSSDDSPVKGRDLVPTNKNSEARNQTLAAWLKFGCLLDDRSDEGGDKVDNFPQLIWGRPQRVVRTTAEPTYSRDDAEGRYAFPPSTSSVYSDTLPQDQFYASEHIPSFSEIPLGGFVFIGNVEKVNTDSATSAVIGWAVVDRDEIEDTMLFRECGADLSFTQPVAFDDSPAGLKALFLPDAYPAPGGGGQYGTVLSKTFLPFFVKKLRYVASTYSEAIINPADLVIMSYPWVLAVEKLKLTDVATHNDHVHPELEKKGYLITSLPAILEAQRNFNGKNAPPEGMFATVDNIIGLGSAFADDGVLAYEALVAKDFFLLIGKKSGDKWMFGTRCELDPTTLMPKTLTFGWCEPCTASTLAYQKVVLSDWASQPSGVFPTKYTFTGENREFNVSFSQPSSLTDPPGPLLKYRLEKYLREGVMPVLDLSDYSDSSTALNAYVEGELTKVLDNQGAVVVVVGDAQTSSPEDIYMRAKSVKDACPRCLVAFRVSNMEVAEEPLSEVRQLLQHPLSSLYIDLVVLKHSMPAPTVGGPPREQVVGEALLDLASISYKLLNTPEEGRGKPSIVLLTIPTEGATSESYVRNIIDNQLFLIKSGIMGVVVDIVRDSSGLPHVLVSGGRGIKNPFSFCGLEKGSTAISTSQLSTIIQPYPNPSATQCVPCTDLDILSGRCSRACDDGKECALPEDAFPSAQYRCPDNRITEECTPCSLYDRIDCTIYYRNGTIKEFVVLGEDLVENPDFYSDVLAALPKGQKCCVEVGEGDERTKMSFYGVKISNPNTQPLIFPANGDTSVSCAGEGVDMNAVGAICGFSGTTFRDYVMECTPSGAAVPELPPPWDIGLPDLGGFDIGPGIGPGIGAGGFGG